MHRRRILLLLTCLLGPVAIAAQEMPIHLRIDAKDRGCAPVLDTTRFPGLTLPLWRFGVYESGADTLKKASAAYWCELPTAEPVVAIVIWREWGDSPVPGGCTTMIKYARASVGGLRFERRGRVDLRAAHPVDEPARKGPPIVARGTVIISEYDGRVTRFICHTGRWYVSTG
jgi:hypothetical protein